jgi:hypothetical protein
MAEETGTATAFKIDSMPRTGAAARELHVTVYHEMGRGGHASPTEQIEVIPPSRHPTTVRIQVVGVGDASKGLSSPTYMASIRRRKAASVAALVRELGQHADKDDFTVYTFPVLDRLKEMLGDMADAEMEGNTREIIRQLRNTLLNAGWNRYREPAVRTFAAEILTFLASAQEVEPNDVERVVATLNDLGLDSVGVPLFLSDEDQDDEEGGEISG